MRTRFALIVGPDNRARLRLNVAMMKSLGIEVEILDAGELRRVDPRVNIDGVTLAAYEPLSGYADPIAATRSFALAAERHGAVFRPHMPVSRIMVRGGRAIGVADAAGNHHEADAVCIAAGPWTDRLLAPLGVAIGLKAERAQIAFLRRDPAVHHLAYIDCITGSYFRPHGDGLTLVGMGAWRPEPEPDPDSFHEGNDQDFVDEIRRRLGYRIPAMREAQYARGHAGVYDVSPDSRAVLGAVPAAGGLYVAAGFSGTGFKTAPAVGAAMADLILNAGTISAEIEPFGFDRILAGTMIRSENEYAMGAGFGHTL